MTVDTCTARFDAACAVREHEERKVAPFIFATATHNSHSDRLRRIPTIEILRRPTDKGFVPVAAKQSNCCDESNAYFTKHPNRLRGIDVGNVRHVGYTICKTFLENANDCTSAYDLVACLFRISCQNSPDAQASATNDVRACHSGDVVTKTIKGIYSILQEAEKRLAASQDWSKVQLAPAEQLAYAAGAHIIDFGCVNGKVATQLIQPKRLFIPRRCTDKANVLWTAFDVNHKNAIHGGLRGSFLDANGNRIGRVQTCAATSFNQDIKLNNALWLFTQTMTELKGVKAAA